MRNEIHQFNITQEISKEEALKEAVEAEEQRESAGITLNSYERKALYEKIKTVPSVVLTGDVVEDKKATDEQLAETVKIATGIKQTMLTFKGSIDRGTEDGTMSEEQVGAAKE